MNPITKTSNIFQLRNKGNGVTVYACGASLAINGTVQDVTIILIPSARYRYSGVFIYTHSGAGDLNSTFDYVSDEPVDDTDVKYTFATITKLYREDKIKFDSIAPVLKDEIPLVFMLQSYLPDDIITIINKLRKQHTTK